MPRNPNHVLGSPPAPTPRILVKVVQVGGGQDRQQQSITLYGFTFQEVFDAVFTCLQKKQSAKKEPVVTSVTRMTLKKKGIK